MKCAVRVAFQFRADCQCVIKCQALLTFGDFHSILFYGITLCHYMTKFGHTSQQIDVCCYLNTTFNLAKLISTGTAR